MVVKLLNKERKFQDYAKLLEYLLEVEAMIEISREKGYEFNYVTRTLIGKNEYILSIEFTK